MEFHRIIELQITDWFWLEWGLKANSPTTGRAISQQTGLLKTPSSLALKTSRGGARTASPGKPVPAPHHMLTLCLYILRASLCLQGMLNNTFSNHSLPIRVTLTHLSRELLTDCSSLFTIAR